MTREEMQCWLIRELQKEMPRYSRYEIPEDGEEQWNLLRGLFNVRPPIPVSPEFLRIEGELLEKRTAEKGITALEDILPIRECEGLYLWQGDITTLRVDAIVNAANSQMLGCFRPNHSCIDNIIHTMAGVEMRLKCAELMEAQGHEEPTGQAKLTPAYHLPSRYVIHTVGPIVEGELTQEHCGLLAYCYRSCLETAEEGNCKSIAFCCISTGVFGFPQKEAAQIAVRTVREYRQKHDIQVIFNVFKEDNHEIYKGLLGRN